jgi:hypothetical protein
LGKARATVASTFFFPSAGESLGAVQTGENESLVEEVETQLGLMLVGL